jgi:hypothetical protein
MALAGYWLEAVLGVSDLDFAHTSLRYVSGGKGGWWIVGTVYHLVDSVLLGILYAAIIYRRLAFLEKRLGRVWGSVAAGCAFATAVWLILGMLIAMPFMGAGVFGRNTRSVRPALASFGLHLIFGALLGPIYSGPFCRGSAGSGCGSVG